VNEAGTATVLDEQAPKRKERTKQNLESKRMDTKGSLKSKEQKTQRFNPDGLKETRPTSSKARRKIAQRSQKEIAIRDL